MKRKIKLVKESINSYYIREGDVGWEETRLGERFTEDLMERLQDLGLTLEEADFVIGELHDSHMSMWIHEWEYDGKKMDDIAEEAYKLVFKKDPSDWNDINEFARKRGRPRKKPKGIDSPDAWGDDDSDFEGEVDPDIITTPPDIDYPEEEEDTEEDLKFYKKLKKILRNELSIPEFNRGYVEFKLKSTGEMIKGIPMAELKDAFLFKVNDKLRKIKINDMIIL